MNEIGQDTTSSNPVSLGKYVITPAVRRCPCGSALGRGPRRGRPDTGVVRRVDRSSRLAVVVPLAADADSRSWRSDRATRALAIEPSRRLQLLTIRSKRVTGGSLVTVDIVTASAVDRIRSRFRRLRVTDVPRPSSELFRGGRDDGVPTSRYRCGSRRRHRAVRNPRIEKSGSLPPGTAYSAPSTSYSWNSSFETTLSAPS